MVMVFCYYDAIDISNALWIMGIYMNSIASEKSLTAIIGNTGPKISSVINSDSNLGSRIIVGDT